MVSGTERWAIVVADGDGVEVDLPAALDAAARARRDLHGGRSPADAANGSGPLVIAADGGALRALDAGVRPALVIGDGDSLGPTGLERLRDLGLPVRLSDVAKDESDTELCLVAAVEAGARAIRIVGALGGPRLEHGIANLLLLAHPLLDGLDVALVAGGSTVRRVGTAAGPGALDLAGEPDDHVSLLPIDTEVEGVRTAGLRYPLLDESLRPGPARGLSNELLGATAQVATRRGRLLVIHTPRTPQRSE